MTDDVCRDCGEPHFIPEPCGHATENLNECHSNTFFPCPTHFSQLMASALITSHPGHTFGPDEPEPVPFMEAVSHLNADRMMGAAWWTWMALTHRYALDSGDDRQAALESLTDVPELPEGAPPYLYQVAPLMVQATTAAVSGGYLNAEAIWYIAQETLDADGAASFLKSTAASAHIAAGTNPACTQHHLAAYGLLGSQVDNGRGMVLLPELVDVVVGLRDADVPTVRVAMKRVMQLAEDDDAMAVEAVEIVGRTLAQTQQPNATVFYGQGRPGAPGSRLEGVIDVDSATLENTPPELMAGVWATRVGRAYANAASWEEAAQAVSALAAQHPQPGRFVVDVLMAGGQMLGYLLDESEDDGTPTPS